ncbi:MAG: DinB family protein [Dehalococcoidia bacterium]
MPDMLLQRLFLDAQAEFLKAIDHVPNPGRGGAIGSLNPASWTVAHLAMIQDAWINAFCAGDRTDPWLDEWSASARREGPTDATIPAYQDARAAFERVAEKSAMWVEGWSWEQLEQRATLPDRSPADWQGATRTYLVARAVAHAFVHAGELSVVAALMAADDLGLPGDLARSSPPTAEDDPSVPVVAALVRDGFVEVRRIAVAMPTPAVEGAMDRLNPVSQTLVHVLQREDRLWSQVAQGNEPNATLATLVQQQATGDARPLSWGDCLDALDHVEWNVGRWLATVTPRVGATPMKWRDDSSYAAQMARSATHLFSHAGEMMAHASLYGVADVGQPGPLARVREVSWSDG